MPLYDNIADALPLVCDDHEHTVTIDCSGATNETNETTGTFVSGWTAGVWLKLDLSDPGYQALDSNWPAGPTDNEGRLFNQVVGVMSLTRDSGTFTPYVESVTDVVGGFDPSSPDFDKLDRWGWTFGDGNPNWGPETLGDRPDDTDSVDGIFYLKILDWDWLIDADGQVTITYRFTPPDLVAADLVNPASTTAFIDSGWVRDEQILYPGEAEDGDGWFWAADPSRFTDTIIATPGSLPGVGVYDVFASFRIHTGDSGFTDNPIALCRNGLVLRYPNEINGANSSPSVVEIANRREDGRVGNPSGYPIRGTSKDILSIRLGLSNTSDLTSRAEISRVTLRAQDPADGAPPGDEPLMISATELPLGYPLPEPEDFNDWEAGALNENFGEVETISLTYLDGALYMFWVETTGTGASFHISGPEIKKWDGSSWTVLTNDLWGHGSDITYNTSAVTRVHGSIASCTDDTYVYFAWAESDGTQTGSRRNWHWRCKRYDPGTDTFTELGTGPNSGEGNRRFDPAGSIAAQVGSPAPYSNQTGTSEGYGTWGHGMTMAAHAGRVWLAMVEPDTSRSSITLLKGRPCVWYWDGAAWNEDHPPNPSLVTGAADFWADGDGTSERVPQIGLNFIHADGDSDWPAIIYQVGFFDGSNNFMSEITHVYCERDSGGWGSNLEILSLDDISGFDSSLWNTPLTPGEIWRTSRNGFMMFKLNGRPAWFSKYNSFVTDPGVIVSIDADGNGMTYEAYPSEVTGDENFGSMADLIMYGDVPVIACPDNSDAIGNFAFSLYFMEEMGTGDGFHGAKNFADRTFGGYSCPSLATDGTTIWMAATDNSELQVWAYNPEAVVVLYGSIKFP